MLRNPFPTVTTHSKAAAGASAAAKPRLSEAVAQALLGPAGNPAEEEVQSQSPAWAASPGQHPEHPSRVSASGRAGLWGRVLPVNPGHFFMAEPRSPAQQQQQQQQQFPV